MFTGIVEELGAVRSIRERKLSVGCSLVATDSDVGSSVAVNGVCLTVVERTPDCLSFELSEEEEAFVQEGPDAREAGDVIPFDEVMREPRARTGPGSASSSRDQRDAIRGPASLAGPPM